MSNFDPDLIKKFENIRLLHKPGERFDVGAHFDAVAKLPFSEQATYITWSAQLPEIEQPLATPAAKTVPISRETYITALRYLDPLDYSSTTAFATQTQFHVNGAPPAPLAFGQYGADVYALKSQSFPLPLQDAKSIDPRGDMTLRQDLICFKPGPQNEALYGPEVGVYLGQLVVAPRLEHVKHGVMDDDRWKDSKYHCIMSSVDKSVWLMLLATERCDLLPEELQRDHTGHNQKLFGLKIFDGVDKLIAALDGRGNWEIFAPNVMKTALFGDTKSKVGMWVVRSEDLQELGLADRPVGLQNQDGKATSIAVSEANDDAVSKTLPSSKGWKKLFGL